MTTPIDSPHLSHRCQCEKLCQTGPAQKLGLQAARSARICNLGRRGAFPRDFAAGLIAQGQSHSAVGTSRSAALFGGKAHVSDTVY